MYRAVLAIAVVAPSLQTAGCGYIGDGGREVHGGGGASDAREASLPMPDADVQEKPPIDAGVPDAALPVCTPGTFQLLANPGFDEGAIGWTESNGPIIFHDADMPIAPHAGTHMMLLGLGFQAEQALTQVVEIPTGTSALTWNAFTCFDTDEVSPSTDSATLELRGDGGAVLATIAAFTVGDSQPTCNWFGRSVPVTPIPSGPVEFHFRAHSDNSVDTSFWFDSLALEAVVTCP